MGVRQRYIKRERERERERERIMLGLKFCLTDLILDLED
jgi:hypothetical protein